MRRCVQCCGGAHHLNTRICAPSLWLQVAAPYCPDPSRAGAFVTNWAVSTVSRSIKLSWMVDPAAAQQAQQAGQAGHAQAPPPAAHPMALQHAASLLPPAPAAGLVPQPLPMVHLPAHWQLGPAAQVALSQQRAAVTSLMARMQVCFGFGFSGRGEAGSQCLLAGRQRHGLAHCVLVTARCQRALRK